MHDKCTVNIILSGKKLKATLLKSGTTQKYPLLHFYLKVFDVKAKVIRQKKKEIKGNQFGKEEAKLASFAGDIIIYIYKTLKTPQKIIKNNKYSKVAGYTINRKTGFTFSMLIIS